MVYTIPQKDLSIRDTIHEMYSMNGLVVCEESLERWIQLYNDFNMNCLVSVLSRWLEFNSNNLREIDRLESSSLMCN